MRGLSSSDNCAYETPKFRARQFYLRLLMSLGKVEEAKKVLTKYSQLAGKPIDLTDVNLVAGEEASKSDDQQKPMMERVSTRNRPVRRFGCRTGNSRKLILFPVSRILPDFAGPEMGVYCIWPKILSGLIRPKNLFCPPFQRIMNF